MRRNTVKRLFVFSALVVFFAVAATGLYAADKVLKMATTTSTNDTGLLDYLAPLFKADTGIELQWVSVGTGMALAHGKNCDVDVLLVHDPDSEKKFMEEGNGVDRTQIMYNDFVIIGPKADPAGIKGKTVKDAFQAIAARKAPFTSRSDKSGTHMKELFLWKAAGMTPPEKEAWYVQTGQGMLPTINIAAEKNGYTLTDRGTYIKYEANFKGNPPLAILVEGDKSLLNQYSVIPVNPKKCTNAKYDLAQEFSKWMASARGQKLIADFKLMKKQLFFPNAGSK
jgi:tungstate transport system substrate-binding protein